MLELPAILLASMFVTGGTYHVTPVRCLRCHLFNSYLSKIIINRGELLLPSTKVPHAFFKFSLAAKSIRTYEKMIRFVAASTFPNMSSNADPFEGPHPHHTKSMGKKPSHASATTAGHHESTTSRI